jgi:ATP-dependent DNA helicase DinG
VTRAIKASSNLEVDHRDVLAAAVRAIGGTERPGQVEMADAIAECLESDHHLLVQAGTGTGKSLGYLAPALLWLVRHPGERIVVATATLALQSQLANNDIPAAVDAVESVTGHRPRHAILKGRTNYVCLLRLREGTAQDQGALIPAGDLIETIRSSPQSTPESALGAEVLALRRGPRTRPDKLGSPTGTTRRPIPSERGLTSRSRFESAWVRSAVRTVMSVS